MLVSAFFQCFLVRWLCVVKNVFIAGNFWQSSSNVHSNIGKSFLKTVKEKFPPEHKLHKIFNTNTVKLSYSCMPNVKNIIDGHNKKTLERKKKKEERDNPRKTCNCRNPNKCPLKGQCLRESIIYQATVTTYESNCKETYIGLTKNTIYIYQ